MVKTLEKAKLDKTIVSLYSDANNTERFSTGIVIAFDEKHIIVGHITPNGRYDGYLIKRMEDVFLTKHQGKYEKKIKDLFVKEKSRSYDEIMGDDLLIALLTYAKDKNMVTSIQLLSSGLDDVVGLVEEVSEKIITIREIDQYGDCDGFAHIETDSITRVSCDSEEERDIKTLFCALN